MGPLLAWQMVAPPLWWAYRKAARQRSTLLLVSLMSLLLVSVYHRRAEWALDATLGQPAEGRAAAAPCQPCTPWRAAALVERLPHSAVRSGLADALSEAGLSTHCGQLQLLEPPLCRDQDLLPPRGPCLVYSAAPSARRTLEVELARWPGCEVHLLGGALLPADRLPANVSQHQVELAAGAGHRRAADGRRLALMTLEQVTALLGHGQRPIHYLRLSDGTAAGTVLEQQLSAAGAALDRVLQLSVPLPLGEAAPAAEQRRALRTLTALRAHGLRLAHAARLAHLSASYETLWVRWEAPPCGAVTGDDGRPCCGRAARPCDELAL
ncbi:hypothetical protein FJT64_007267 [Amphibalanus amphitrite]|uniref:Uncharacterized protein n=1 Tax=Amphibalanus amphitrite TaxID=1232801 RepID=A0A6A4VU34_AMPAM|nr:hypothetical protein FJT64_007267 [Amphibalanus amphitrite]